MVFDDGISEKIESSVFVVVDKMRFDKHDPISVLFWNCVFMFCILVSIFANKKNRGRR